MDEAIAGKLAQRIGVVSDQLADHCRSLTGGGSDKRKVCGERTLTEL